MNLPYHAARALGWGTRALYRRALPLLPRPRVRGGGILPLSVYAFAGESVLPEQVASIRSFLRWVGQPRRFVVVSDGSLGPGSVRRLEALAPGVVTVRAPGEVRWPAAVAPFQTYVDGGAPLGRKLGLLVSLPRPGDLEDGGTCLYVDSDVLFFPGAQVLADGRTTAYLRDCDEEALDGQLLRGETEGWAPVNSGFIRLGAPLDWSLAAGRFRELGGAAPGHFAEQTLTHLTLRAAGAPPLDPVRHVVARDDEFGFADRHAGPGIVLRHYVSPVRHKFWVALWGNSR